MIISVVYFIGHVSPLYKQERLVMLCDSWSASPCISIVSYKRLQKLVFSLSVFLVLHLGQQESGSRSKFLSNIIKQINNINKGGLYVSCAVSVWTISIIWIFFFLRTKIFHLNQRHLHPNPGCSQKEVLV